MSAHVFVLLYMSVFAAGGAIACALHIRFLRNLAATYRRLAEGCGGKATPGNLWFRPTLNFQRRGANVYVETIRTRNYQLGDFLEVYVDWQEEGFQMTVRSKRLRTILANWFGAQSIWTGDPSFDARYRVTGNRETSIRERLSPAVRQTIETLRSLDVSDDMYVAIREGQLVVRKRGHFHDYDDLVEVIGLALSLYDRLRDIAVKDKYFIEPPPPKAARLGRLPAPCSLASSAYGSKKSQTNTPSV